MSQTPRSPSVRGWEPTKFVRRRGRLRAGTPPHVAPGSVLTVELLAAELDDALSAHAGGTLLDLGCGHAPLRVAYVDRVDRFIGIDWPSSVHGPGSIDVFADLTGGIPVGTGVVDTLILTDVLEHLPEPLAALAEVHRVLRPGGVLLLTVPFLYGLHEEPYDFARYTEHGLRHLLDRVGMEVERLIPYGGSGDVIVDLGAKHLSTLGALGRITARALQRTWLRVRRVPGLKDRRTELRRRYPLGYLVVARKPDVNG